MSRRVHEEGPISVMLMARERGNESGADFFIFFQTSAILSGLLGETGAKRVD